MGLCWIAIVAAFLIGASPLAVQEVQRRRTRKTFEKYVSPDVIKLIEKDPNKFIKEPQQRHFQFVLVSIRDTDINQVSTILDWVMEAVFRHKGLVSMVSFSLVDACLGAPWMDADRVDNRLALVNELLSENGDMVRIAHGQCEGLVGNMGCSRRFTYGALIPGFSEILKRLLDTPFGTAFEVETSNHPPP